MVVVVVVIILAVFPIKQHRTEIVTRSSSERKSAPHPLFFYCPLKVKLKNLCGVITIIYNSDESGSKGLKEHRPFLAVIFRKLQFCNEK